MRFWDSFSMMGKVAPYNDNVLDFDRRNLFPRRVTMFLLCGNDGNASRPLHAPTTIRYDKGGCAIHTDYGNFTATNIGDGRGHGFWYLVEVGNNRDTGNEVKRGNGVPDLWEVEEDRTHNHRAGGTPGDYPTALVYLRNSTPRIRTLECFQQIRWFPA